MSPDYKQIYLDIINEKFPDKLSDPLIKNKLNFLDTSVDIIRLNNLLFGEAQHSVETENQKLRSYDKSSILEILDYQKKNGLSNNKIAGYFKISRNTISKWKIIFGV